ncbi:MAG: PIN domain-containing protein [Firmicutes bacterium]|nr:PIN domain-containing protein [Bacillota bacterium]
MKDSPVLQFVDTNVLVYAHDVSAGEKHERAKALITDMWNSGNGCLSIQVLQEFYVTMVRKVVRPLEPEVAFQVISDLSQWRVHVPDISDILGAIRIHQRNKLSFWDSLILRSAKALGCEVIWTEDFNCGQCYEGVKALNPFS